MKAIKKPFKYIRNRSKEQVQFLPCDVDPYITQAMRSYIRNGRDSLRSTYDEALALKIRQNYGKVLNRSPQNGWAELG